MSAKEVLMLAVVVLWCSLTVALVVAVLFGGTDEH